MGASLALRTVSVSSSTSSSSMHRQGPTFIDVLQEMFEGPESDVLRQVLVRGLEDRQGGLEVHHTRGVLGLEALHTHTQQACTSGSRPTSCASLCAHPQSHHQDRPTLKANSRSAESFSDA